MDSKEFPLFLAVSSSQKVKTTPTTTKTYLEHIMDLTGGTKSFQRTINLESAKTISILIRA